MSFSGSQPEAESELPPPLPPQAVRASGRATARAAAAVLVRRPMGRRPDPVVTNMSRPLLIVEWGAVRVRIRAAAGADGSVIGRAGGSPLPRAPSGGTGRPSSG